MTALVIAEHDKSHLRGGTANAITAAAKMGGDVHVLVAGTGAKGAAEVNICPPMAAIANAIERATGKRMTDLPMSPPKVLAAIDGE